MSFLIESSDEFLCRAYGTAEEALEAFAEMPPDVVLMDINLPGMDGIACSRIIKEKVSVGAHHDVYRVRRRREDLPCAFRRCEWIYSETFRRRQFA
ncbi:MAG: response regulator [Candidatus Pollutiaquabacter aromativorans]